MVAEKQKSTTKRVIGIVSTVLMYLFFIVCIFAVVLSFTSKRDKDGAMNLFGTQMRIVQTASMQKSEHTDVSNFAIKDLPTNTMVFVELVPKDKDEAKQWYANLKVGDVLTFKYVYVKQETITHRIIDIKEKADGYIITLQGDNKSDSANLGTQVIDTADVDSPDYILGKVTGSSYIAGMVVTAVKSPVGMICIVIVPCVIIIILEIIRIVGLFTEKKKKEQKAKQQRQEDELQDLKRQLAELQQTVAKPAQQNDSGEEG